MKDEKDSVRLQRVVDAMDYSCELPVRNSFNPEIFDVAPRKPTLKEYNQKMEFLLYLAEHPNLVERITR
jgi:hypothetical protein